MDFMSAAVDEAYGGPFGAVVVKDGKIIARGHNMVLINKDPTAHAEVTAIRNACKLLDTFDLSGCELYTSCYPCPMCLGSALWARLDSVFYAATPLDAAAVGFSDQAFYDFMRDRQSNETMKIEPLQVENYKIPFYLWLKMDDKTMY